MVLGFAASLFFAHFGVGTLMALTLIRESELKRSFYLFTSAMAAVLIALGLFFGRNGGAGPGCFLTLALLFALGFYSLMAFQREAWGRACLLMAVVAGLIGVLGLQNIAIGGNALLQSHSHLLSLNAIAAMFLCGIVLSTLILGHWYLISPQLSFRPLLRGAWLFFAAVCLRALVLMALWYGIGCQGGLQGRGALQQLVSLDHFGWFFWLRIFWGIVGPLVLSVMIAKTAAIQSNQSATGILYVALVFVMIGELIADTIWAMARLPL